MDMKRTISTIIMAVALIASVSADRLYIAPCDIVAGETVRLELRLDNESEYSGFQTDLYLPDGLSIDTEYDEYIIDLTDRAARSHSVSAADIASSGAIRIWVSSQQVHSFTGNSGAVATISVTAATSFVTPATIELKNSILVGPDNSKHILDDEKTIVGDSGIKGDINDDGSVDGNDVSILLEMVLAGNVTDEQKAVADINDDTSVDGNDVSILLEIVLAGE